MAYALAMTDAEGRVWFLRRGMTGGNLMRTRDPLSAHVWDFPGAVKAFIDGLSEARKEQLVGRELDVVPISATAGPAVLVVRLDRIEALRPHEETERSRAMLAESVPGTAPKRKGKR